MGLLIELAVGLGAWVVVAFVLAVWFGRTADLADDERPDMVASRAGTSDPRTSPRLATRAAASARPA